MQRGVPFEQHEMHSEQNNNHTISVLSSKGLTCLKYLKATACMFFLNIINFILLNGFVSYGQAPVRNNFMPNKSDNVYEQ